MRRRQGDRPAPGERLQHGRRERASLGGVGAAPDLVEEHERPRPGPVSLQDIAQGGDVGGERGEARGDRLAIPDVGEHAREHREGRLRADRRDDAALRHEGEQAHRFDEHRLAAGVRARDQHRALIGREHEIERHDDLTPW